MLVSVLLCCSYCCGTMMASSFILAAPPVVPKLEVLRCAAAAGFGGDSRSQQKTKKKKKTTTTSSLCPCQSGKIYSECCLPYHKNHTSIDSPSALLRARYSAFSKKVPEFIADTTHPRNEKHQRDREAWSRQISKGLETTRFTALRIGEEVAIDQETSEISFECEMQPISQRGQGAKAIVVHETSTFLKENETWFYLQGRDINAETTKGAA